ncbi:SEC-C motif-containing protein [Falsibacillus pallidus]|uniref:SEC-C motif-containing protein n=1 Tax=Falsibacillus pallidus TaxID=493781 RepID=A0A370GGD4_9BACI|nr:SEC-C motif-containing protein [Falsibacillus pallidus]
MVNYRLKSKILEVVDNQLNMNDPKCTRRTLNRLMDLGFEEEIAKQMIATVLTEEIYFIMKKQDPFNEKRYEKKLALLPDYLDGIEEREYNDDAMPVSLGPSVGRNDPCPCGSGKKYKKCCGK